MKISGWIYGRYVGLLNWLTRTPKVEDFTDYEEVKGTIHVKGDKTL